MIDLEKQPKNPYGLIVVKNDGISKSKLDSYPLNASLSTIWQFGLKVKKFGYKFGIQNRIRYYYIC